MYVPYHKSRQGCSQLSFYVMGMIILFILVTLQAAGSQVLAPLDFNQECVPRGGSNITVVLMDSRYYTSLDTLWFADDESIDLFAFPVPVDPVKWELVDRADCNNVWQYCGNSSTDILITQLIQGVGIGREVIISVEYSFSSAGGNMDPCSSEGNEEMDNVIIVEVDDTTGLNNIHTEVIPQCRGNRSLSRYDFSYMPMNHFELVFRSNISSGVCVNISRVLVFHCYGRSVPSMGPRNSTVPVMDNGFSRGNDTVESCLTHVGFNMCHLEIQEGSNGNQTTTIPLFLSHTRPTSLRISVNLVILGGMRNLSIMVESDITFPENVTAQELTLIHAGNVKALEEDIELSLILAVNQNEESVFIGGPELFGQLNIRIVDDDVLFVGFAENLLVLSSFEQTGRIGVNLSTSIGREVAMFIRVNDSLSPDHPISQPYRLLFSPNDSFSTFFTFNINSDHVTARYVLLTLEVAAPQESLNRFRNKIVVGRQPGFYQNAVVLLEGSGAVPVPGLSEPAKIGLAFGIMILCICVLLVLVLGTCCYFRKKSNVKPGKKLDMEVEMEAKNRDKEHHIYS